MSTDDQQGCAFSKLVFLKHDQSFFGSVVFIKEFFTEFNTFIITMRNLEYPRKRGWECLNFQCRVTGVAQGCTQLAEGNPNRSPVWNGKT
jgi:hypothetical protein